MWMCIVNQLRIVLKITDHVGAGAVRPRIGNKSYKRYEAMAGIE